MKKFRLIILAVLIGAFAASAQNGTMTPYSRYAYGILGDHATSAQRAMGSVGYAMNSGRQINVMNPASYAAVDSLTFLFDIGLNLTSLHQSENNGGTKVSDNSFGGGLDYVTMQFPICRYIGASVGLVPYSSVGYSFGSKIDNGIDSRQGSGSLNEFYVGVAARPFAGFSLGFNASYLFGTILNDTYGYLTSGGSSLFQNQMQVRDYHFDIGLQYTLTLPQSTRLTAGLTYSPAKDLLGTARTIIVVNDNNTTSSDIVDHHRLRHNYSLPEKWGAGINLDWQRRLMVEFDFTYQPWSKAKYRGFESTPKTFDFADRTRYAIGAQYTPSLRGGYFRRINYRLGASYTNDYLRILASDNTANRLREYTVTAGFGFPVPTFKTIVSLGFEYRHRKAHPNPLITENYFGICIGVNFNEMWFRQSKIY